MSIRTGMNASDALMKRYFEWERADKLMLSATRYRLLIQCIHKLVQRRAHFRERILFHGNNLTGSVRGSLGQINGISRKLTLVLGQDIGTESENGHTVLAKALDRLGRHAQFPRGWSALLGADPLPDEFDDWLAERFGRRVHPQALDVIANCPGARCSRRPLIQP